MQIVIPLPAELSAGLTIQGKLNAFSLMYKGNLLLFWNFIEKYSSLYLQIKDLYYKNNKDINPHKILEKYLKNFDYSNKIMGVTIIRPPGNKSPHLGLSGRKEKFIRALLFIGCNSGISLKKILKLIFNKIFNFNFLK